MGTVRYITRAATAALLASIVGVGCATWPQPHSALEMILPDLRPWLGEMLGEIIMMPFALLVPQAALSIVLFYMLPRQGHTCRTGVMSKK